MPELPFMCHIASRASPPSCTRHLYYLHYLKRSHPSLTSSVGVLKLKGISQDFESLQNKCSVLRFYTLCILCCMYHSRLPWGNRKLLKRSGEFYFQSKQNGTKLKRKRKEKLHFFYICTYIYYSSYRGFGVAQTEDTKDRILHSIMFLNYHLIHVADQDVLIKSLTLLSVWLSASGAVISPYVRSCSGVITFTETLRLPVLLCPCNAFE